ncbi:MAG: NTP transferase domain-containing protein [Simkaniaceae bacterium]|nr:NTP transferase domain-containing protein [Simkaniaceae bacterium]MCF7852160.1 NTP transferase domain-containing protein [Simkaniaceae bacterium]
MKVVILAGGKGRRLWPISTRDFPKTLHSLGAQNPLVIETIQRFQNLSIGAEIYVQTGPDISLQMRQLLDEYGYQTIPLIIEPFSKNTAFAVTFALKELKKSFGLCEREPILFSPSDHQFESDDPLIHAILNIKKDFDSGWIYLFGLQPTSPKVEYGYIEVGERCENGRYKISHFHEKPHLNEASKYALSRRHYWNSGLFCTTFETLQNECERHAPDFKHYLENTYEAELLPSLSFDHLILEKSMQLRMIPIDTEWCDIGSFDAIYERCKKDGDDNVCIGNIQSQNSHRNLIISKSKPIKIIDVDDLIVAESSEGICIMKRGSSQKNQNLSET